MYVVIQIQKWKDEQDTSKDFCLCGFWRNFLYMYILRCLSEELQNKALIPSCHVPWSTPPYLLYPYYIFYVCMYQATVIWNYFYAALRICYAGLSYTPLIEYMYCTYKVQYKYIVTAPFVRLDYSLQLRLIHLTRSAICRFQQHLHPYFSAFYFSTPIALMITYDIVWVFKNCHHIILIFFIA